MKGSSGVLLVLIAVAAVSAFPLAGDVSAQTQESFLESAETVSTTQVRLTFTEDVDDVEVSDFTVDGVEVTFLHNDITRSVILQIPPDREFAPSDTPLVAFASRSDGIYARGDPSRIQTEGSINAVDGIAPTLSDKAITGPNKITITYDEPVTADISNYTNLRVANLDSDDAQRNHSTIESLDLFVHRNIMDVRGSGTDTHVITFYGTAAATGSVAYVDIVGYVEDLSPKKNAFVGDDTVLGQQGVDVGDGQGPAVESIKITSDDTIYVEWSEPVTSTIADYVNLRIGSPRNVTDVANPPNSNYVALTFGGAPASTSATGVITINPVSDTVGNKSIRQPNIIVADGQAPSLVPDAAGGLKVTGPNTITITFNEPVRATEDSFSDLMVRETADAVLVERVITGVNARGNAITITFGGGEVKTDATARISVVDTGDDRLVDVNGNTLYDLDVDTINEATEFSVADGQAPKLVSLGITSPVMIEAEFSEDVNLDSTLDHFGNFRITGESGTREINDVSPPSDDTIFITFAAADLDDDPNTESEGAPVGATGTINIADTITDTSGNEFPAVRGAFVAAAQAPFVESINITGPDTVTAIFSESIRDVTGGMGQNAGYDFADLRLRGEALPREIMGVVHDGKRTVTITFDNSEEAGGDAPTGATATIDIAGARDHTVDGTQTDPPVFIKDVAQSHNFIAEYNRPVGDGQSPTLDISITGPNQVTAAFSESVSVQQSHFENLMMMGETEPRKITGFRADRSNPNAYIITLEGAAAPPDATGMVSIGLVADSSGNQYNAADPVTVKDGQVPTLEFIGITHSNEVTARFSELVTTDSAGFTAFQVLKNGARVSDFRNVGVVSPTGTESAKDVVLSFSGEEAPLGATGLITIAGVADPDGNEFAGMRDIQVRASQIPFVTSANITGPNEVTIEFSETVNIAKDPPYDNFAALIISGETLPREIMGVVHDGKRTVTITFDNSEEAGGDAPTGATATINIDGVSDTHDPENNILSVRSQPIGDGQEPALDISITGPNQVTAAFSESVIVQQSRFEDLIVPNDPEPREITAFRSHPNTPDAYIMTFDGAEAPPDATGTITTADISDLSRNKYLGGSVMVGDGQVPTLLRAEFFEGATIRFAYSEPVLSSHDAYTGLQLGGSGDFRNIVFLEPVQGTDFVDVTYSGSIVGSSVTASISVDDGVADPSMNALSPITATVHQRAEPVLESAEITATNKVTLTFSEPVKADRASFFNLNLTGESTRRVVTDVSGSGTDTIILTFEGTASTNTTGTIDIDGDDPEGFSGVTDLIGVPLASITNHNISAVDALTLVSAEVTGPNQITATFSKGVNAAMEDFTNLVLVPGGARNVTAVGGSSTDTITISFDGNPVPTDAAASITIGSGVTDADRNAFTSRNVAVSDGQAPRLDSVTISSSNTQSGTAESGDTVALIFTASEVISATTVTINAEDATATKTQGNTWTAARTIAETDPSGPITFAINFEDMAGNVAVPVTETTDGTGVSIAAAGSIGTCPQGQQVHPYGTECITPLSGTVTVGLLLSEAEGFTQQGEETRVASEKAVSDFNAWLSSQGRQWTLAAPFQDTNLDGPTTLSQVQGLKAQGTDVIAGIPTSATLSHVKDYVNDNGMVVVSCCSTAPSLAEDDGIFRMIPDDSGQAPLLAKHISDSGKDTIITIYRNDTWGNDLNGALTASFAARNGTVASEIPYTPGTSLTGTVSDASAALQGLDTNRLGIVFLGWGEVVELFNAASANQTLGTVTWFGSGVSANDEGIINDATALAFATSTGFSAIEFAEQPTDVTAEVASHIQAQLGRSPTVYAHTAYDAIWVAGLALDRAQSATGTDVLPQIIPVSEARTAGAVGPNALNENGDLALANYHLWAVDGGQWVDRGPVSTPSIRGAVFSDENGNGVRDAGEAGISTTVTVLTDPATETMTDASGTYSFANIPAGEHTVRVTVPDGHVASAATPSSVTVTVVQDQTATVDFALERTTTTVRGAVFSDTDGDGVRDPGEAGIENYTMNAIDLLDGQVSTSNTAADGTYAFDIRPNSVTLVQAGFFPPGHTVADVRSSWFKYVEPAAGETATFDVGFYPVPEDKRVTLDLTVFLDGNRNGMMDAGEGGIGDVSFTVYTYTIGPETVTTDADGTVTKTDLVPADWAVLLPLENGQMEVNGAQYLPTVYMHTTPDGTVTSSLVAEDPEPGAVHSIMIGFAPAQ